jgi:hypothetical protein
MMGGLPSTSHSGARAKRVSLESRRKLKMWFWIPGPRYRASRNDAERVR